MLHIRLSNAMRARIFRAFFARRFGAFGKDSLIVAPIGIERPDRIYIGKGVYVAASSCLAVHPTAGKPDLGQLEIGDGCKLGRFNHLYATGRVKVGPKVLTANGVYISDNLHEYRDPATAVMDQPLRQVSPVEIGQGSWIGHNACIIGAKLGKNCVVGANSVVLSDAPDYSVMVGAPARIVKRFDSGHQEWRATEPDGTFRPI